MKHLMKDPNCPSSEDLMAVILDGEGDHEQVTNMRAHVSSCPRCSVKLDELTATRALIRKHQPEPVRLSPMFSAQVMDGISGGFAPLFEDILGISRKAIAAFGVFSIILLLLMVFPQEAAINVMTLEELIMNGREADLLVRQDITRDDVVTLVLTQR